MTTKFLPAVPTKPDAAQLAGGNCARGAGYLTQGTACESSCGFDPHPTGTFHSNGPRTHGTAASGGAPSSRHAGHIFPALMSQAELDDELTSATKGAGDMRTIPQMLDARRREEWWDRADRRLAWPRAAVIGALLGLLLAIIANKAIGIAVAAQIAQSAPVGW